ncbi:symporter [Aureococcus anophagefferens]|nr:symporter [Aureococcus anophagefferens]
MERLLALVLVLRGAVALDCSTPPLSAYPYCDRALPIRARVADLAARFTVNETISQMGTMAAAVPRLGLPALNYGGEALHGVWSTCAAGRCPTQFPAPHAMGASFDRDLWRAVGAASGLEARALFRWNQRHNASDCARSLEGCLGLTFYAPNVNLARDPRWGRIEEVPSEDPLLNGVYGAEFVRGFQGDGAYRVANAVVKHFAVYNLEVDVEDTPPADWCGSAACAPPNDRHSFDARVSPRDFEETYVGPFVAPVAAGAAAAMCSYNAVNGEPACTDGALLRGALRGALNFTGVLATDCGALEDAVARHKRYATEAEAAAAAIAAGVDSNCGKVLTSALPEALAAGLVRPDALRPPLERLLEARLRLGLLDDWDADAPCRGRTSTPSTRRRTALRAQREGLVLLQNPNQILPLDGRGTLAVIGPNANASMNLLSGYHGTPPPDLLRSPLQELEARWRGGKVVYAVGCNASGAATAALDEAVDLAKTADVVVLGLGLCGDNYGGGPPKEDATCFSIDEAESVDRTSLKLPGAQEALFSKIWALGKPVAVAVFLVSAGAVDASFAKDKAALLLAGYGGEFGGVAVADALLGAYNPGGALTATMLPDAGLPPFRDMAMRPSAASPGRTYRLDERRVAPLWRFGFGLSYTAFAVSLAGPTRVPRRAATRFSVVVRNVGAVSATRRRGRRRRRPPGRAAPRALRLCPRPRPRARRVDEGLHGVAPAVAVPRRRGRRPRRRGRHDVRCSAGRVADTEDIRLTVD